MRTLNHTSELWIWYLLLRAELRAVRGVEAEINARSTNRVLKYQSGSARLIRVNSDSVIPFVGSHLVDACLDPCRVQALFIWRCSGKVFFRGVLLFPSFLYTYFEKTSWHVSQFLTEQDYSSLNKWRTLSQRSRSRSLGISLVIPQQFKLDKCLSNKHDRFCYASERRDLYQRIEDFIC